MGLGLNTIVKALIYSDDPKAIGPNITEMEAAGKPYKQALAIALNIQSDPVHGKPRKKKYDDYAGILRDVARDMVAKGMWRGDCGGFTNLAGDTSIKNHLIKNHAMVEFKGDRADMARPELPANPDQITHTTHEMTPTQAKGLHDQIVKGLKTKGFRQYAAPKTRASIAQEQENSARAQQGFGVKQPMKKSFAAIMKGDLPGHEFHGNQYGGGSGVYDHHATHTLNKEIHSFTERKFWPAGTPVSISKPGKGGASDRSQVMNSGGHLGVAWNKDLTPIVTKGDVAGHEFHGNQWGDGPKVERGSFDQQAKGNSKYHEHVGEDRTHWRGDFSKTGKYGTIFHGPNHGPGYSGKVAQGIARATGMPADPAHTQTKGIDSHWVNVPAKDKEEGDNKYHDVQSGLWAAGFTKDKEFSQWGDGSKAETWSHKNGATARVDTPAPNSGYHGAVVEIAHNKSIKKLLPLMAYGPRDATVWKAIMPMDTTNQPGTPSYMTPAYAPATGAPQVTDPMAADPAAAINNTAGPDHSVMVHPQGMTVHVLSTQDLGTNGVEAHIYKDIPDAPVDDSEPDWDQDVTSMPSQGAMPFRRGTAAKSFATILKGGAPAAGEPDDTPEQSTSKPATAQVEQAAEAPAAPVQSIAPAGHDPSMTVWTDGKGKTIEIPTGLPPLAQAALAAAMVSSGFTQSDEPAKSDDDDDDAANVAGDKAVAATDDPKAVDKADQTTCRCSRYDFPHRHEPGKCDGDGSDDDENIRKDGDEGTQVLASPQKNATQSDLTTNDVPKMNPDQQPKKLLKRRRVEGLPDTQVEKDERILKRHIEGLDY